MRKLRKLLGLFLVCMVTIMCIPSVSFAALGDILTSQGDGWQRIDETDENIVYNGPWLTDSSGNPYNGNITFANNPSSTINFNFYGSKLRILVKPFAMRVLILH